MIFNQFCKAVDKLLPKKNLLHGFMRKAKLFIIEDDFDEIFENSSDPTLDTMASSFLPFNYCVFNTDNFAILVWDESKDENGIVECRGFAYFIPVLALPNRGDFMEGGATREDYILFVGGITQDVEEENNRIICTIDFEALCYFNLQFNIVGTARTEEDVIDFFGNQESHNEFHEMMTTHLDYISYVIEVINQPKYFIVEERSKKKRLKVGKKKIPRDHQRSKYIILKPYQIRRKLKLAEPTGKKGGKKAPHERRRHERFLSHEIYKKDENGREIAPKRIPYGPRIGQPYYKKTIIDAHWVGPSESEVDGKIYKVLLNV